MISEKSRAKEASEKVEFLIEVDIGHASVGLSSWP